MRIQSLLQGKGHFVARIDRQATVVDASAALHEHGVGALVVSPEGRTIDGIISERDIARSLARHGEAALALTVGDLMTAEVTTCSPDATVDEIMALMTERRIRHVPVVVDGALAGIISIGDVVKSRLSELETESRTLHDYIALGR